MTHVTSEDNMESVNDHMPTGLIERLKAVVKRAAAMPKWESRTTFTLDDPEARMSMSVLPNAEAGWDAYAARWGHPGTVRIGHQLTLEGAICVCESYMAKLVRDA